MRSTIRAYRRHCHLWIWDLFWLGLLVTALILGGVFVFPAFFWLWMAGFGGGTLVLTGFYVRHFWR